MPLQFQQTPKNKYSGCLAILRDPIWQFVFGFLACLISVIGIVVALPQAAPIRSALPQVIRGKYTPSAPSTPVSTATPLPGTPLVPGPVLTPPAIISSEGRAYNTQLACSTKTCVNGLQVTLVSSTVNVAKKQVALTFTVLDTSGNTSYDDTSGVASSRVTLQSPLDESPYDGYTSDDAGRTQQGIPFYTLQPGQRIQITIKFDFVPYKGVSYQLLVNIDNMGVNGYFGTFFTLDPVLLPF